MSFIRIFLKSLAFKKLALLTKMYDTLLRTYINIDMSETIKLENYY